ncbi:MAG: hypothetical protein Q9198_004323 [Flavoplaca austrocitrina]
MKHIKSNPDGGRGQHHSSYDLLQEAIDCGCLICKRFGRRTNFQQLSADYSEFRLMLSYYFGQEVPSTITTSSPAGPDGTVQLFLKIDKLEPCDIADRPDITLENLILNLVPIQSDEGITILGSDDDESLGQTGNGALKSLKATTTDSPECLAIGMFWLQKCIKQHTTCARPALESSDEMRPSRLIKVGTSEKDCLKLCLKTDFPEDLQYATLSHCWGVIPDRVHLITLCLEAWQTIIPNEALMPTFKDAIKVT